MNTITIGISDFSNVLPGTYTSSWNTLSIQNLFAEPLVRTYDGKIWPALAKSWQVFDQGCRWLFSLRPKAMFHDNTPCTSVDVLDCIEMAKYQIDEYGMPSQLYRYLQRVHFSTLDTQTLEVTCDEPNGDIADFLSEILIRKSNRTGEFVIGTGSYEFTDFIPKRTLRLRRIDESKRFSTYKEIHFRVIPDALERLNNLLRQKIDYATDLGKVENSDISQEINWYHNASTISVIAFLDGSKPPFDHLSARRAINQSIDKNTLISKVLNGNAIPAATVVSPFHCGYESTLTPIPYNPEEAQKVFNNIEMPKELVIRAPSESPDQAPEVAAFIAESLSKIGIKSRVDIQTNRPRYAFEVGRNEIGHIAIFNSSPYSTFRILSDKIATREKGIWWQGVEDNIVDDLILAANKEADITTRERKYAHVLKHLNQNPPWLYLYHPILVCASRKEVTNIELLHSGALRFPGVW